MSKNLYGLFNDFFALLRFKKKPQDFPASVSLLITTICFHICVNMIHASILIEIDKAIKIALLNTALLLFLIYLCLVFYRLTHRWRQTIIALAGADCLLGLFVLPATLILNNNQGPGFFLVLGSYLILIILFWGIVVYAHVFRHAFSSSFVRAVCMAIVYNFLSYFIVSGLVPELNNL